MAGPASSAINPGDMAGPKGSITDGNAATRRGSGGSQGRIEHASRYGPSRRRLNVESGRIICCRAERPRTPARFLVRPVGVVILAGGQKMPPHQCQRWFFGGCRAGTSVPAERVESPRDEMNTGRCPRAQRSAGGSLSVRHYGLLLLLVATGTMMAAQEPAVPSRPPRPPGRAQRLSGTGSVVGPHRSRARNGCAPRHRAGSRLVLRAGGSLPLRPEARAAIHRRRTDAP